MDVFIVAHFGKNPELKSSFQVLLCKYLELMVETVKVKSDNLDKVSLSL